MTRIALCIAAATLSLSACTTVSPRAQEELAQKPDCRTAYQDIRILEEERASVGKRILSGVRFVSPAGAVVGLLSGDYANRVNVATGQYNDDIDRKIKQIRTTCGIKTPYSRTAG